MEEREDLVGLRLSNSGHRNLARDEILSVAKNLASHRKTVADFLKCHPALPEAYRTPVGSLLKGSKVEKYFTGGQ